ncbi:unnamed protein product, partial [Medioppia subpectinata]
MKSVTRFEGYSEEWEERQRKEGRNRLLLISTKTFKLHDWDLSWNSNEFPEFTLCFEETLLVWIPCLLLWLLSLYELTVVHMLSSDAHFTGLVDSYWFVTRMLYFPVTMNPEETASFLSRVTFWWFNSMIFKGYKKPLATEDMWS